MTEALPPPPKKDPQRRTVGPTRPPEARSRAALGLTVAAAEGRFELQRCNACGAWQYPPRDACARCLSPDLSWDPLSGAGQVLAETKVRTSPKLFFRERVPWRMGTVRLDALGGAPVVLAHLHGEVARHGRVRLELRLDRAGQGVMVALPEAPGPNWKDDPLMRDLSASPKHRRVLMTDARAETAPALAEALFEAGAALVFAGEAETWRSWPGRARLEALGVEILPLDVTDTASVKKLAGEIGGKVDILVNNGGFMRPGGVLDRSDTGFARDEMDVNCLGLMRLAQAFGPGMCGRTADGVNSAAAWVNIFSVGSLATLPGYGAFAASQAAARAVSLSMRGEVRSAGLRVMNVYTGPTDTSWFQPVPPPKVTATALARAVVDGLERGLEDVWCGDVARDMAERFRRDPKVLERELTMGEEGP
ncbi:MAG: SDR family oxidoreductase [Pseudomonadota bacterium]